MFFRGSEKSDGSGLGLYIVKETLDKLNGSINFTSVPSEGTSFEVSIPLNDVAVTASKEDLDDSDGVEVQQET